MSRSRRLARWLALGGLLLAGCRPALSYQWMAEQPRYEAYEDSQAMPNGQSAQPLMPGTVPRGHLQDDELLYTGLGPDGEPSEEFPFGVTRAMLERGQERYNAYCTPCHGYAGYGQGIVVERGYTPPPSFHSEELRAAPAGYLYRVITNGAGQMPPYAELVDVNDRWAIVAYIRALQLSQNATLDDVPPEEREQLPGGAAP